MMGFRIGSGWHCIKEIVKMVGAIEQLGPSDSGSGSARKGREKGILISGKLKVEKPAQSRITPFHDRAKALDRLSFFPLAVSATCARTHQSEGTMRRSHISREPLSRVRGSD